MKGFLHKTEQGWVVKHSRLNEYGEPIGFGNYEQLPLHPDEDELKMVMILNVPVCEFEGKEVEFEIVNVWETNTNTDKKLPTLDDFKHYAKLINPIEPTGSKVDLNKLEAKFNEVLSKETAESLKEWLDTKRGKEQQKQLITEIMEEDAKDGLYDHIGDTNEMIDDTVNDTINKMAEEMYGKGKVPDYEEGFIDGYNKAKEKYKYDYSQECKCDIRGGETWCCNVCGLPCKTSETLYTEEQVREIIGKAQLLNHNDEFAFTEEYLIQSLKESKK